MSFNIEIITPEKILLSENVDEVIVPSFEGEMTILKEHCNLLTFLRPGLLTIISSSSNEKFFIEEGTVEFFDNKLLILTSKVANVKSLTNDKTAEMIKETSEKLNNGKFNDKEKYLFSHKLETLKLIN
jgi:ATP synthase F1 epsilon subunit